MTEEATLTIAEVERIIGAECLQKHRLARQAEQLAAVVQDLQKKLAQPQEQGKQGDD